MRFFCSSYCVLGKSSIPTTNIGSRSLQTASSKFGFSDLHFQTCSFFRGKVTNPPQVFFGLYSSKTTEAHDVNAFQGCRRQLPWPSGRCCRGRRPCGTRCPGGWAAPGGARGADVAGTLSKSCQRLGRKPQGCLRM